ncbi:MAG: RHS repeat-associated core domain-containing protein, partial [Dehalococcoidia bacterium]
MDGDQCFSLPAPFCVGGLRVVNLGWLGPSCGVVPSEENSTPDSPWLAGAVKEITRLDSADGNIVQATRFWYSAGTSATQSTTHGGTRTAYIVRESAVESRVALSTGGQKCHYTVHALDADGFTDTDYLYGDRSDSTDDRCVTYLRSKNTSAWLLDYPYRVRQYGGLCTTEVARQDIAYDNLAIGTAPTRGAVTQTREYTTSTAFLTTGFVRDLYGRVTQVTMPNGYDTSGNLIGGGAGQRITTSYSPSVDNYTSITTSDQLGYVTTQSRDPRFGVITTTVNPRNAVTTVGYDLLGRVSTVILPTEQGTGTASQSYFYRFDTTNFSWLDSQNLKNPNTLQSYDLFMSSPNNWRERWTIFDGLARVRQEQSRSPAGSGSRIVTHTLYDDRGLLQRTTVPLYDSFNAPNGTIWPWIIPPSQASGEYTYGYDTLERLTVTQTRNGAATWTSTNTYEGDRVLASPPSGTAVLGTRTWLNGHGETRFVDELKPGGTWARTSYAYDGAGRLSTITNPAGNVTTSGYDRAGRRTSLTDPDQGAWTFVYDNNSNLTSQTDALAQTVASTFDNNNRITSKRVGTASGQLLASWTYANPGTSLAGLLTSSTAYDPNTLANGYTANYTAYDLRNRNTAKNVVVANEGALNGTFAFTYAYDPGDNLISMTYPAVGTLATGGLPAETVATGYNALGFIVNTTGTLPSQPSLNAAYVGNTLFNPDGTVSSREAGTSGQPNFFRQQSTYDSILRLASLNTRSGSSSTLRRVRSYTYDNISNITRIRDTTSGAAQSECFTYDHRARLIHAWTNTSSLSSSCTDGANPTWNVGPDPYRFVLTYSDIGNITSLATNAGAAQSYTYGAKPHAVTNVGGTAYTYNSNGEMLTGRVGGFNSSTLAWDRLHQLRSVANANGTTTFVYDADGERLIRRDPNGEKTLYVDGMEVKLQASALKVTRWYQHGGETVAVRQPGGALFWLGGNHQGSNEVAVNAGNGAITVQRFTPFGDLRPATSNLPGERAFLDEPRDPSEGLSYLNARYYDSKLLRFINPDPLMAPYSP